MRSGGGGGAGRGESGGELLHLSAVLPLLERHSGGGELERLALDRHITVLCGGRGPTAAPGAPAGAPGGGVLGAGPGAGPAAGARGADRCSPDLRPLDQTHPRLGGSVQLYYTAPYYIHYIRR